MNFSDQLSAHYSNEILLQAVVWIGPAVILIITLLREGWIGFCYSRSNFRSQRLRIVGHHAAWVTLYFFVLVLGTAYAAIKIGETPPFNWVAMKVLLAWGSAAIAAGVLAIVSRSRRKNKITDFVPQCSGCAGNLENITESFATTLTNREQCEVGAGGYRLEVWRCLACAIQHVYFKKWFEAGRCPKCSWRTLRRWVNVLKRATTNQSGRVRITLQCKNPGCGFSKVRERSTNPTRKK